MSERSEAPESLPRRGLFVGAGAALTAVLGAAACVRQAAAETAHHHGDHALADVASDCVSKGRACLAHCIALLGQGDQTMAECAKTAHDMTALMDALAVLAASGGKHLAALAKVAREACKDCEAACRKHEDKHPTCKACAEACARAVAATEKV